MLTCSHWNFPQREEESWGRWEETHAESRSTTDNGRVSGGVVTLINSLINILSNQSPDILLFQSTLWTTSVVSIDLQHCPAVSNLGTAASAFRPLEATGKKSLKKNDLCMCCVHNMIHLIQNERQSELLSHATKFVSSDFTQVFVKYCLLLSPCSLHKSFIRRRLWRRKKPHSLVRLLTAHAHIPVKCWDEGSEVETLLRFNEWHI